MNILLKEVLIVLSYVIVVILAKINVDFMGIAAIALLPVILTLLISLEIKQPYMKSKILFIIWAIFYKTLFIISLFFALNSYPGKDVLYIVSVICAFVYGIFQYIFFKNNRNTVYAILYINIFSFIILFIKYI